MRKLLFTLLLACSFAMTYAQTNVIDKDLQEVLNQGDEMINVNIILKSQMEPSSLRGLVYGVEDKSLRRDIVVKELMTFAEKSQEDLLSILKSEEMRGEVTTINSHWLSNTITCTISKDLIYLLSTHDDVALIGYNSDKYALWEEESESVSATRSVATNISQVHADDVWEQGYTGKGVLVAILDTGVNYEHADLADHLWDGGSQYPNHGYNSYDDNNDPMDRRGHGTHCAGTICGDGSSGTKTGVAPEATLMIVKALNDNGNANANSIVSGMEFAVEHGADVLSMSLGIANSSVADRTMLRQTCVNVLEAGVVASIAAGNEGTSMIDNPIPNNIRVPSSCPPPWIHPDQESNAGGRSCVVSVGAVDNNDTHSYLSSQGPVTWQNTSYGDYPYNPGIGLIRPDICAPGIDIVSLDYSSNNAYTEMDGTSMAAPCVAGVICLMLSRDNTLTPEQISEILETSAERLSDNKNNQTGSGRVDALAAVNAIDMGTMTMRSISIDDEDGNDNACLNPGENVILNIDFDNVSSQSYNNVSAVLKCESELVNITKSNVDLGSIDANSTFSVDGLSFTLSSSAQSKTSLFFDVEFYNDNDKISTNRIVLLVYDNTLQFAELIVRNDDNGNGILETGESADLGVVFNNVGNEIAVELDGTLSSSSNQITINSGQASFGSIGTNASSIAYFNVTLANNASSDLDIPFEIEMKDKYDNVSNFEMRYLGKCGIVYDLYDEFGDGWSGAKITAIYGDGSASDEYTITNGEHATYSKELNNGTAVILEWKKGALDAECSYIVSYDNGAVIYSGEGTKPKGEFFRWINNCSCQNATIKTCEAVKNLNISKGNDKVYLSWEAPSTEVDFYEIYRDTELIGVSENLSFIDDKLNNNGTYHYNVRPVYESCNGALVGEEIYFELGTKELEEINVDVYPNPSNDRFIVRCENMTNIVVFNLMGEEMMNVMTDDNSYEINGLKSGIYFINVKSEIGNVIHKVVKY